MSFDWVGIIFLLKRGEGREYGDLGRWVSKFGG